MTELYRFTPALEKPENLQKLLVGRESLLKRLLQAIHDASKRKSLQHFLIIGPRGIGKTHLLLLLYHSVKGTINWDESCENLSETWEPLLFSEEQYGMSSLAELLIGVLARLKDEAPDEKLMRLHTKMKDAWMPGEAERETILEYLLTRRSETGKRLLLLLDNLQLILGNFSEEDQGRLREILLSKDPFMIIGSAPTLFNAIEDYEAPFYNFFEIIWLKDISREEVEVLLKKRLEHDGRTDILEKFDEYRPRIRAIHHLTGGNPRLILSLYQILKQAEILEVERALLKLLDELTPYFQDRMNGLSDQQRKAIEAMALMEGPSTPTNIAHFAHLAVNVVTSQLKRLQALGYVLHPEKQKGKRGALYDISDQLFRLWRQMRVEAGRRRLRIIVTFLKIWFTEQELRDFATKTIQQMLRLLSEAKYEQVRETVDKLYYVQEAAQSYMHSEIHFQRVHGLASAGDLTEATREIQEREARIRTPEDEESVAWEWIVLGNAYYDKQEHDQAIDAYRQALKIKPDKHEAWNNLGIAYAEKQLYDQAIDAYRQALKIKPDMHEAWNNLGIAYRSKQEHDQAIDAFTHAIGIGREAGLTDIVVVGLLNRSNNLQRLAKRARALQDSEEAYRIAVGEKSEDLIRMVASQQFSLLLIFSRENAHEGNEKQALEDYQRALGYLPQVPMDIAQDLLTLYFKVLLESKATEIASKALDMIDAKGSDWAELLKPYREALRYLKTKDKAILNRLFPEIRQIVEQMVAHVEGKSTPRSTGQPALHSKARKKRRRSQRN